MEQEKTTGIAFLKRQRCLYSGASSDKLFNNSPSFHTYCCVSLMC